MLSKEFLAEAVIGTLPIAGMTLLITQHFMDRLSNRPDHAQIKFADAKSSLEKVAKARKKIARLDAGQQFWVVDHTAGISIGLRRQFDGKDGVMRNIAGTIITPEIDGNPGIPNGNRNPIINLP